MSRASRGIYTDNRGEVFLGLSLILLNEPLLNVSRSFFNSIAEEYLSVGLFSKQRSIISENSSGNLGLSTLTRSGTSLMIDRIVEIWLVPEKGRLPVANSKRTIPREKTSDSEPTLLPSACSGDI